jgi:hypothetical protein
MGRGRGSSLLGRGDCGVAVEERACELDDRHFDHFAVDGDGADPLGEVLVVGLTSAKRHYLTCMLFIETVK